MTAFKDLGLSSPILKVLEQLGFEKPTDIQAEAIPQLLEGERDFIGLAQTGTGKTAAFGLPLLERIDPNEKYTQALVLAPTRELGQQIAQQLNMFSKYLDRVNVLAVYGGANIMTQIKALKKTQHVIIATPGRLIDLIKRKAVKLNQLQLLVLDEADEMLNMGFKEDIDEILSYAPEDTMTWLFSATMPSAIKKIVKKYMDNPAEVKVNTQNEVNANIKHRYVIVKQSNKTEALTRMLDINPEMRGVVFCRTKRDTQNLAEELLSKNYKADALHGDLSQAQRDRVMNRFKAHDLHVLIATDVAARGIDVNDLTHVIHHSLPDQNAYYTHRSGRTARAGKKGTSLAFITGREVYKIRMLEKQLGIVFKKRLIPSTADIEDIRIENWCIKLLEQKTKGKIDEALMAKVKMLFSNLTKDEIIAKVLAQELKSLNLGSNKDLNEEEQKGRSGGERRGDRSGGRDRRRGGNDRRRRERPQGGRRRDNEQREGSKDRDKKDRKKSGEATNKDHRSNVERKPRRSQVEKKDRRKGDFGKSRRKKKK